MTSIAAGTTTVATYGYDPSGRRVSLTAGTETSIFPTDTYAKVNGEVEKHVFANGTAAATVRNTGTNAQPFWNFVDHLNSTRFVTDAQAKIREFATYEPFGSLTANGYVPSPAPTPERKKYTGHELDSTTGLTYAQSRYLDTNTGRFVSEDPAFLLVGSNEFDARYNRSLESFLSDPQLSNAYTYARNNPVRFVDEDGECVTDPISAVACAYLLTQIAFSLYDLYNTLQAFNNPSLSGADKFLTAAVFFGGIADPIDGGYTGLLKKGNSSQRLYRVMQETPEGEPAIGETSSRLGVRVGGPEKIRGKDIYTDTKGMVHPGEGGMSVFENPYDISVTRRPPEWGGTGNGTMFCIECSDLPATLQYRREGRGNTHGFIEPSVDILGTDLNPTIWSTQPVWKKR